MMKRNLYVGFSSRAKVRFTSLGAAVVMASTVAGGLFQPVFAADQAGRFEFALGVGQFEPHTSSTELGMVSPVQQPFPGSGFMVDRFTTLGAVLRYWVTDSTSLELLGGIPRTSDIRGTGTVSADPINPLGATKAVAPTVLYRYHFSEPTSPWRPSIAAGVNYTTLKNTSVSPQFQAFLSNTLTQGASTAIPSSAEFSSSWNPAVSVGLDYKIDADWKLSSSLTYIPLKSTATISTIIGNTVFHSQGRLTVDPSILFVGVARAF